MEALDGKFGILQFLKKANNTFIVSPTHFGEADLPRGAIKQPHAERILQCENLLAGRRTGRSHCFRSRRKAAFLRRLNEHAHIGKLAHDCKLTGYKRRQKRALLQDDPEWVAVPRQYASAAWKREIKQ